MAKKKQKELHELIEELSVEYQDKREFIRQYDNSKFSEPKESSGLSSLMNLILDFPAILFSK